MWTLFIVSAVIGLDEPKVTRYSEYEHQWQCQDVWRELSYKFTQGEVAYCEEPE
jgi:hypothetical protein